MAQTQKKKPIAEDEYPVKRINDSEVRYHPMAFRGKAYELREITAEQGCEVTDIYAEVGFLHASGLTGGGDVNINEMFSKLAHPNFQARWLAAVLVHADGTRATVEEFKSGLQRELTALYTEAFQHFFSLNPSVFENFMLALSMGPIADRFAQVSENTRSTQMRTLSTGSAMAN